MMLEDTTEYSVMSDGLAYDDMSTSLDIVSRYQGHINNDEQIYLEARKKCDKYIGDYRIGYLEGFKDGYCKAKEE